MSEPKTTLAAALDYIARGWSVVPIPHKSKGPIIPDWQSLRITGDDAQTYFNGAPQNIGVHSGEASDGLSDVDMDSPEAITGAAYILPSTATFGHKSKGRSHWLYKTNLWETESVAAIKFMAADQTGLLELRTGGNGRAAQTVFPPSTHPSGELIEWDIPRKEPAAIDGAELLRLAKRLAAVAQLARAYPKEGCRHDASYILGGFLARCGISTPQIKLMVNAIGAASSQPRDKISDMIRTAEDGARSTLKAGFPKLSEAFGDGPARRVAEWLCYRGASEGAAAEAEWPSPSPLPGKLLDVAPLNIELLPRSIREWVMDAAERMQCPPDFVAIPAIVALGSVIGRKVAVRPNRKTDWYEVANLWGMVVGRPGVLKSPAMDAALAPLHSLEKSARLSNETARKLYEQDSEMFKIKKEAGQSNARAAFKKGLNVCSSQDVAPEKPKYRKYVVNDSTYEALGVILEDNPNGTLTHRDELVSLLKYLDREENTTARSFFLSAWSGTRGYTFNRIGRGETYIEAACLSLVGTTQPGLLTSYLHSAIEGGSADDGMIQRFNMLVWPDQPPEWRKVDKFPDSAAKETAFKAFRRLDELTPLSIEATVDEFASVPYLRFDDAAQGIFDDWHAKLERDLRAGTRHPALESHYSKYRTLVPALALINHLADGGFGSISEIAVTKAVRMSEYLKTHVERAYAAGIGVPTSAAEAILARVKKGDLVDGFTARDIYRNCWSGLTDKVKTQDGLELLENLDWLRSEKRVEGGRPTVLYRINPKMQGAKARND